VKTFCITWRAKDGSCDGRYFAEAANKPEAVRKFKDWFRGAYFTDQVRVIDCN
jgi:hypothetical protein